MSRMPKNKPSGPRLSARETLHIIKRILFEMIRNYKFSFF